jgi:hypothetical protein
MNTRHTQSLLPGVHLSPSKGSTCCMDGETSQPYQNPNLEKKRKHPMPNSQEKTRDTSMNITHHQQVPHTPESVSATKTSSCWSRFLPLPVPLSHFHLHHRHHYRRSRSPGHLLSLPPTLGPVVLLSLALQARKQMALCNRRASCNSQGQNNSRAPHTSKSSSRPWKARLARSREPEPKPRGVSTRQKNLLDYDRVSEHHNPGARSQQL